MALTGLGSGLRLFINYWFYSVHVGQFIIGLALPLILNSQIKFVGTWFEEKQRGLWISLLAISNPVGVCVGFVLPQFLITADESADPATVHSESWWFMLYMTILFNFVFLLTLFFVKDGPGPRKSKRQMIGQHERMIDEQFESDDAEPGDRELSQSVCAQIKLLMNRPVFIYFLIIYSIGWGAIPVVGSTFASIIHPYGYSPVIIFLKTHRSTVPSRA
jgi:sugar phosphate permease